MTRLFHCVTIWYVPILDEGYQVYPLSQLNIIYSTFLLNTRESCCFQLPSQPCRQVIENSFGILAARWRFLRRPLIAHPEYAILFVKAAIGHHNYLRTEESCVYCPPGFFDSEDGCGKLIEVGWRRDEGGNTGMTDISLTGSNR